MSDLSPFVDAAIRDPEVGELMKEHNRLKRKVEELVQSNYRQARTLAVTGPDGVVYAKGQVDTDGYDYFEDDDDANMPCWKVDLTKEATCPYDELENLKICIGTKSKNASDGSEDSQVFFSNYNAETCRAEIQWNTAPRLIDFHLVTLGPLTRLQYETLIRDHQNCRMADFASIVKRVVVDGNAATTANAASDRAETGNSDAVAAPPPTAPLPEITIEFDSIMFNHYGHTDWNDQD